MSAKGYNFANENLRNNTLFQTQTMNGFIEYLSAHPTAMWGLAILDAVLILGYIGYWLFIMARNTIKYKREKTK